MRALNRDGRGEFTEWILGLKENPQAAIPLHLLSDDNFSCEIAGSPAFISHGFVTKYDLAETLAPVIEELGKLRLNHECWPDIWDAMALFYFESICPKAKNGEWAPNRIEHYIYDQTHTKSRDLCYRHRIFGPVRLYRVSHIGVKPFFQVKPCVHGDYEEHIGSSDQLAGNSTILELLSILYVNDGKPISGYTNKKLYKGIKKKLPEPGSLRRIPQVCKQLRRTYDLPAVSCESLLQLLPQEFHDRLEA